MKRLSSSRHLHYLLLLCLAQFLVICLGFELFHNHEPDFEFHNDCPACQWQNLYQDDYSQAGQILAALDDPLFMIAQERYGDLLALPGEEHSFPYSSRAPPQSA